MLWKQMLCRLTTHHWPSPTILPLSHKHSLSLACSITYLMFYLSLFLSFVLFGTHTNTQQNLDTHEVALFVNKSRVLCWVCGLMQKVRTWRPEFPSQTPCVINHLGVVRTVVSWTMHMVGAHMSSREFRVESDWVMSWFFSYTFLSTFNWIEW